MDVYVVKLLKWDNVYITVDFKHQEEVIRNKWIYYEEIIKLLAVRLIQLL